ncbi:hypothetical protein [Motiliproteus sediminis]|uniref:hypothetical protein n=1 Tax=Motiliproteus sediminis TaxID=1468178 RepID=UPI001AEFFCD2|nr:hypothetical protein [Motiliproteus sediminis]
MAILPRWRRDPAKVVIWELLLLALAAKPFSAFLPPLHAPLPNLCCALTLALITLDAATGRSAAMKAGLPILLSGLILSGLTIGGGGFTQWLLPITLGLAIIVFSWREWQRRPGAGWILLGLVGWLVVEVGYMPTSGEWPALALGLLSLSCFVLAVNKQLRLTSASGG